MLDKCQSKNCPADETDTEIRQHRGFRLCSKHRHDVERLTYENLTPFARDGINAFTQWQASNYTQIPSWFPQSRIAAIHRPSTLREQLELKR